MGRPYLAAALEAPWFAHCCNPLLFALVAAVRTRNKEGGRG
jgi:hypothetical protein